MSGVSLVPRLQSPGFLLREVKKMVLFLRAKKLKLQSGAWKQSCI